MIDVYLFIKIFKIQNRSKTNCLNTCVHLIYLKPMQVQTENYRYMWSPANPLMLGGNKVIYT